MRVVLLPQAREDLDRVHDPLLGRLLRRLEALGEFPELGAPMAGPFAGYRSTVVDSFRVVYRAAARRVEVAYVRDCRRRPLS